MAETAISAEQALFIEEKTKATFEYTIECLDRARIEGNTVLQWFFGVIAGGLAFIGTLFPSGYFSVAAGMAGAVLAACFGAWKLVLSLRSRETLPPGNLAESLNTLLNEPMP